MAPENKSSLKNCFVYNQDQLKSQYGFRLFAYKAHEQLVIDSQEKHTFVFLTKGAISVSINGCKTVNMTQPYLFFIPELSVAKIHILSNSRLMTMCFKEYLPICSKENMAELCSYMPMHTSPVHRLPVESPLLTFLKTIEDILSLGTSCPSYHKLKVKELFFLLNTYYSSSDLASLLEPLLYDNFKLKSFVYKNYRDVNTVNELVEKSGLSRTLFFEQFKKTFGISVKQWMLRKKAELINERLSESNVVLKEVMLDFGFSSASQFNRFCRVYLGDTPSNIVNNN